MSVKAKKHIIFHATIFIGGIIGSLIFGFVDLYFAAIVNLIAGYWIAQLFGRVGKKKVGTESKCNKQNVNVSAFSRDYKRLYEKINKGEIVPCFVDYDWRDGTKPCRDIAKVKRMNVNSIQVGSRGIQYGGVDDFALHGRTELEAFMVDCERMNLEYFS